MTVFGYSPSSSQFSLAAYQEREQVREQQLKQQEEVEKLLSYRAFKDRLTIFLDDLISAPEDTPLCDLTDNNKSYFEPSEKATLSLFSDIYNDQAPAKEILSSFAKVFKWHVNKLQRYHSPETFTLNEWDIEFKEYMNYLRKYRTCIPGTLTWIHEGEYRELWAEDLEEYRLEAIREEEAERAARLQEEEEERAARAKEERLKESRRQAAVKRKETLLKKKLLAALGEEGGLKSGSVDTVETGSTLTPTAISTDHTETVLLPSSQVSVPSTSASAPSTEISGSTEAEGAITPVKLTPAEKRRATMKRKRLEREAEAEAEAQRKANKEDAKPEAVSDGPSPSKKPMIRTNSPKQQIIKLKIGGSKTA
jgi:hypothetical protein